MFRVPFLEPCSGCGGFTEIDTCRDFLILNALRADLGDTVSCSLCACTGVIDLDDQGKFCNWDEQICEECLSQLGAKLETLTRRLFQLVRTP